MIKISDEDIMSFVKESFEKEAKERGLLNEKAKVAKSASEVEEACAPVSFPTPSSKELFRDPEDEETIIFAYRELFSHISKNPDLESRLKSLEAFEQKIINSKTLTEVYSYIVCIRALRFLRLSDPVSAGFGFERFMAFLLDGVRLGGSDTFIDFQISRKQGEGEEIAVNSPYSVKFVSGRKRFRGYRYSGNTLIRALDEHGYMNFLVGYKDERIVSFYNRRFPEQGVLGDEWKSLINLDPDQQISAAELQRLEYDAKMSFLQKKGLVNKKNEVYFTMDESSLLQTISLPSNRRLEQLLNQVSVGLLEEASNIFNSLNTIKCYIESVFLADNYALIGPLKNKTSEFDNSIEKLAQKLNAD